MGMEEVITTGLTVPDQPFTLGEVLMPISESLLHTYQSCVVQPPIN